MSIEGGSQTLTYVLEAVDLASPALRSFRAEVALATKQAQDSMRGLQTSTTEATTAVTKLSAAEKTGADTATVYAGAQAKTASSSKSAAGETAALAASHGRTTTAAKASTAAHAEHSNVLTGLSGKLGTASSKTKEYGSALSTLTTPILAIGAASLYASSKFGGLMEQLHTQAGYSQQAVTQLSGAVVKLAPQLAQGPDAIAEALYHIASVGIPASKAIDVVRASAEGANISGANLNDTANALATTMHNYPGIVGGASAAMGQLDAIVGHGNLHMEDLVTNLGKVVPVAKAIGLTLPEVGSALDVLTKGGMGTASAATALRFSFAQLEKPSSTAIGVLSQLGISQSQLATDLHKPDGLMVALQDLKTHLDAAYPPGRPLTIQQEQTALDNYSASLKRAGTSAATYKTDVTKMYDQLKSGAGANVLQTQDILGVFGGTRGVQGALPLLQNLPELAKVYTEIPKGKTAIDQLNASVAAWDKTQQGQLDHLKAGIEAAGVTFGTDIGPVVLPVLKDVTTGVEDITGAFSRLPSATKHAIEVILGIGVVVGPLLKVLSPVLKLGSGLSGLAGRALGGGAASTVEQDVLGGHGGVMGGLVGARGIPTLAGSLTNPIAVQMVGGAFTPGRNSTSTSTIGGTAASETVAAEDAGTVEAGSFMSTVRGGLPSVIGNIGRGLGIALIGSLGSQVIGGLIGGRAGSTAASAGTDASYGAAAGSLLGPAGALAGGAIGGLFGLASGLGSNSMSPQEIKQVLTEQNADLKSYAGNVKDVQLALAGLTGTIAADIPPGTARVQAMLGAFGNAADAIKTGMDQGEVSIGKGMAGLLSIVSDENAKGVTNFKQSMAQINSVLAMPVAQKNLTGAMKAMVASIEQQMNDGKISVQKGVSQINQILAGITREVDINIVVHQQYAKQDTPLGYNQGMEAIATGSKNGIAPSPTGPVSASAFSSPQAWATTLLKAMGDPVTSGGITALEDFQTHEGAFGTQAAYNPLNVSGPIAGTGKFDGTPAENYGSPTAGIQAELSYFETYGPGVIAALKTGNVAAVESAVQALGPNAFGNDTATPWAGSGITDTGSGAGGGSLTNPAGGGSVASPPSTSSHYDWRTNTYHQFTAAQYKAMQAAWQHLHPHEPMPTKNPLPGAVTGLQSKLRASGSQDLSFGSSLTSAGGSVESTLTSALRTQGAALAQSSETAPGSLAGGIDHSAISQLQSLVQQARKTGNQQLVTGFLKDMESVTKSWGTAISNQFQTGLTNASNAETLSITKQQLGVTGVTVKNGKVAFTGSQTANPNATSATDPAYLQSQLTAYGGYITNLQGERSQLQTEATKAKKDHNTTLLASLKGDMASVDQAISSAKLNAAGLAQAFNQAVYQAMLTSIQNTAAAFDTASSNQGTLASAASALGDVSGTSFSALQALSGTQGGLTGAQKAQANTDLQTYIQGVYAQEKPIGYQTGSALDANLPGIISSLQNGTGNYGALSSFFGGQNSELGVDFGALASGQLNPTDQSAMLTAVIQLISTLANLESGVAQQTQATNTLTGATLSTAAVMSTFGGQVSFTISGDQSGQSYIAGGTPSSVQTSQLGVGM